MSHDALCASGTDDPYCSLCHCDLITEVRQNMMVKVITAIEALPHPDPHEFYLRHEDVNAALRALLEKP